MRTNIDLDVDLLLRARELACARGVTLDQLVTRALQQQLDQHDARPRPFRLVTFGGGNLRPGYRWETLEDDTFPYPRIAGAQPDGD